MRVCLFFFIFFLKTVGDLANIAYLDQTTIGQADSWLTFFA